MRRIILFSALAAGVPAVAAVYLVQVGTPAGDYACFSHRIPLEKLESGRPATELSPSGREALDGGEVPAVSDLGTWTIIDDTPKRVVITRPLPAAEDEGAGFLRTHELIAIERFGEPDANGRPGWFLRSSTRCELRRQAPGMNTATTILDPAAPPPGPDTTRIPVLVTEVDCASGEPATGRVRLITVEEDEHQVGIFLAVKAKRSDVETCPSNPPTPFTIELDAPLAERSPVDVGVYPNRPFLPDGKPRVDRKP